MSAILTISGRATRDPEMQQGKNSGTEYVLDIAVSTSEARMERKKPFTISAILTSSLQNAYKSRRKERNRADDLW